jgi:hypothetical protein
VEVVCSATNCLKVRKEQGGHIVIKLYHSKFTPKQLRILSRYFDGFCPEGHAPMICKRTGCDLWAICRDLQRLSAYAANLANEQEAALSKK